MRHPQTLDQWPNCAVSGCPNKCCLSLKSIRCYPHTLENYTKDLLNVYLAQVPQAPALVPSQLEGWGEGVGAGALRQLTGTGD